MIPKAVRRALHYALGFTLLLILLIVGLAVSGLLHIPATAVLVWSLVLPVLVAGSLSGVIGSLIPGISVLLSHRYRVGYRVIIGPAAAPLAEGEIVHIDLYCLVVLAADGTHVSVTHTTAGSLPITCH